APLDLTVDGGLISFVGDGRFGFTPDAFPTFADGGPANRYAAHVSVRGHSGHSRAAEPGVSGPGLLIATQLWLHLEALALAGHGLTRGAGKGTFKFSVPNRPMKLTGAASRTTRRPITRRSPCRSCLAPCQLQREAPLVHRRQRAARRLDRGQRPH